MNYEVRTLTNRRKNLNEEQALESLKRRIPKEARIDGIRRTSAGWEGKVRWPIEKTAAQVEVVPGPGGIHNAVASALQKIEAKYPGLVLNGESWAGREFELVRLYSPFAGDQYQEGQPVIIEHPNPKVLNLIQACIESASDQPLRNLMQRRPNPQPQAQQPMANTNDRRLAAPPFEDDDAPSSGLDSPPTPKDDSSDPSSDSKPPSDSDSSDGPPKPDSEKSEKSDSKGGEIAELKALVEKICDHLGIPTGAADALDEGLGAEHPEPLGDHPAGGPPGGGLGGPPKPPGGGLGGPAGPGGAKPLVKPKLGPRDTPPGVTPTNSPAFSSTRPDADVIITRQSTGSIKDNVNSIRRHYGKDYELVQLKHFPVQTKEGSTTDERLFKAVLKKR